MRSVPRTGAQGLLHSSTRAQLRSVATQVHRSGNLAAASRVLQPAFSPVHGRQHPRDDARGYAHIFTFALECSSAHSPGHAPDADADYPIRVPGGMQFRAQLRSRLGTSGRPGAVALVPVQVRVHVCAHSPAAAAAGCLSRGSGQGPRLSRLHSRHLAVHDNTGPAGPAHHGTARKATPPLLLPLGHLAEGLCPGGRVPQPPHVHPLHVRKRPARWLASG